MSFNLHKENFSSHRQRWKRLRGVLLDTSRPVVVCLQEAERVSEALPDGLKLFRYVKNADTAIIVSKGLQDNAIAYHLGNYLAIVAVGRVLVACVHDPYTGSSSSQERHNSILDLIKSYFSRFSQKMDSYYINLKNLQLF